MNSTSSFFENRIIISPIIGDKNRHKTKLHPYPIFLSFPNNATNAEIIIATIKITPCSMLDDLKVNI